MYQTPPVVFIAGSNMGGLEPDEIHDSYPTFDDGFVLAGTTESFGAGISSMNLMKIDKLHNDTNIPVDHLDITSVSETSRINLTKLYPNPTRAVFTLEQMIEPGELSTLSILEITGIRVLEMEVSSNVMEVDCSSLSQGIYLVVGHSNGEIKFQSKLMIRR